MNIHWKICQHCGDPFDIATNFDECPICRKKRIEGIQTKKEVKGWGDGDR